MKKINDTFFKYIKIGMLMYVFFIYNELLAATRYVLETNTNSYLSLIIERIVIFVVFVIILFVIFMLLILIQPIMKKVINKKIEKVNAKNADNDEDYEWLRYVKMEGVRALQKIENYQIDFNRDKFIEFSFDVYIKFQNAWQNFDLEKVREYFTDETYNMYISKLETLKLTKKQNIVSDIQLRMGEVIDCQTTPKTITISVDLLLEEYNYIIKTKNGRVVKGSKNKKLVSQYRLDFEKSRNATYDVICDSYGATLENIRSGGKCDFCGNDVIINRPLDFALSKITLIKQRRKL